MSPGRLTALVVFLGVGGVQHFAKTNTCSAIVQTFLPGDNASTTQVEEGRGGEGGNKEAAEEEEEEAKELVLLDKFF